MGMMLNRRRVMGEKGGLLPSGYTQLQWVNTGTGAYIDTGVDCNNTTGEFKINFRCPLNSTNLYIGGQGRGTNQGNTFLASVVSKQLRLQCDTIHQTDFYVNDETWHVIEFTDYSFVYDGAIIESYTPPISGFWGRFCFGAIGLTGTNTYRSTNLDLGECKLLNTHHLIPALRNADNVAGFYNIISKVFMESDNPDVPFIAGTPVQQ